MIDTPLEPLVARCRAGIVPHRRDVGVAAPSAEAHVAAVLGQTGPAWERPDAHVKIPPERHRLPLGTREGHRQSAAVRRPENVVVGPEETRLPGAPARVPRRNRHLRRGGRRTWHALRLGLLLLQQQPRLPGGPQRGVSSRRRRCQCRHPLCVRGLPLAEGAVLPRHLGRGRPVAGFRGQHVHQQLQGLGRHAGVREGLVCPRLLQSSVAC
mmetsp:Transcript_16507/g.56143  ORF Transcript_16507/g.56143 Transcript_16507/m.56143 type:complete len:211 (-) Transcript_16507:614-1246(-)